jgi:hypothetical protein
LLSFPIHPTLLRSPIEDKTEIPPFWHNWGDRGRIAGGAEQPHRTLFPECIWKNDRSAENVAYARKGPTLKVMVATRPKVSSWPDGSTSPGNYDWLFVYGTSCIPFC